MLVRAAARYDGPSWNQIGRIQMGLEEAPEVDQGPAGRWVARSDGSRYFIPAEPEPEPQPELLPAAPGRWLEQNGQRIFLPDPSPTNAEHVRADAASQPAVRTEDRRLSELADTRDILVAPPGTIRAGCSRLLLPPLLPAQALLRSFCR